MKHNPIYTIGCGAWIGGTMMVPGVSGGSMAMILGIYDKLISAVNGVFKKDKRKESLIYLACFMAGAVVGLVLFSKLITLALDTFPLPTSYFFIGAVAGAIPMIFRSANIKKFHVSVIYLPLIGAVIALSIAFLIPADLLELRNDTVFDLLMSILIQLIGGVFIAIAVVLPGVSFSQVLHVLGLYDSIRTAISEFDVPALMGFVPLGIGAVLGVFFVTRLIELALNHYPRASYLIIFGFILGSLPDLFPGVPTGWNIPICFLTAAAGFLAIFFISQREKA